MKAVERYQKCKALAEEALGFAKQIQALDEQFFESNVVYGLEEKIESYERLIEDAAKYPDQYDDDDCPGWVAAPPQPCWHDVCLADNCKCCERND